MSKQELENVKPFLKELLKMQQAIYLACDADVAADVSLKTAKAITLISELSEDNKNLSDEVDRLKKMIDNGHGWKDL